MTNISNLPFLQLPNATIILASTSPIRQNILRKAGIAFEVMSARIDEVGVRAAAQADDMAADDIAMLLAFLKAQAVSQLIGKSMPPVSSSYIIGCDQILLFNDEIMAKPKSLTKAKDQLLTLAGQQHDLLSAIVLICDGQRIWHHIGRASLTMRKFDEAFADAYIQHVGEAALLTPGSYQIESIGTTIFHKIEGDFFDILGLPLMPLLAILWEHGICPVETL